MAALGECRQLVVCTLPVSPDLLGGDISSPFRTCPNLRQLHHHPFFQRKFFANTVPNSRSRSALRSCPGASTPVALPLSSQRLDEAASMKNGLRRSHPSKLGMLSSAFIHICDLSGGAILGTWYHLLHYF